jgi:hypothetical protein
MQLSSGKATMSTEKMAHGGWITAALAWCLAHQEGISLSLEWGLKLAGIVAALAAAYYHVTKARRK